MNHTDSLPQAAYVMYVDIILACVNVWLTFNNRCVYAAYSLDNVSCLFLHCLLDVRSWYPQWSLHP